MCGGVVVGHGAEISLSEDGRAFELSGVSDLAAKRAGGWSDVFTVRVHDPDTDVAQSLPAMAGAYALIDDRLRFTPSFSLAPGVRYRARYRATEAIFLIPKPQREPSTLVEAVYPSAVRLPENLLKFYLHFSAPMAQGDAYQYIKLLDAGGKPIELPFLELAEELWDPEGVRLTLFLDPGRVKRGLLPHEQVGRALRAGASNSLRIDPAWLDAAGDPLKQMYTKSFSAIVADSTQPDPKQWNLIPPSGGSRGPLRVRFPDSLDHGLLERLLTVELENGEEVAGEITISDSERLWVFTPTEPWRSGDHRLIVDNLLEDLAGNSIARPFEVIADGIGKLQPAGKATRIPFVVAEGWPQWRGSRGDSHSNAKGLPVSWDNRTGVFWQSKLTGTGEGTPIIWGDRVFLTSQIGRGPKVRRPGAESDESDEKVMFSVQCLGVRDGKPLCEQRIPAEGELMPTHTLHNLSTPSCVTDGELVIALFATGQLHAFDLEGKKLWQRHLGQEYSPFKLLWGHASSPVLHGDSLFVLCDHNPAAYLLALDKRTGKERWKVDRGDGLRSYSTPIIIEVDGRQQLVVNSNPGIDAYDPSNGKLLWNWKEFCKVPVPVPTCIDGVLFASRGYSGGPFMAIRPGEAKPLWRIASRAPYVSSILHHDGLLYLASERGQILCCDAASGEIVWSEKFVAKCFWASPVYADGKIYLLAEDGDTIVLKAGREREVLAINPIGEFSSGSLAIACGRVFIRTKKNLFCIGKR